MRSTGNVNQPAKILQLLAEDEARTALVEHPVLRDLQTADFSKQQVEVILGQWYHPLRNFPYFLSSMIAHCPRLELNTFVSTILWQELGTGDPRKAHLNLYTATMTGVGFDRAAITAAVPFESTARLVDGYRRAARNMETAMGFLYGTEVADLAMVSSIGKAVANATGQRSLPWVDIHIAQEPDHVDNVNKSLDLPVTAAEAGHVLESARRMWRLWIDFFETIESRIAEVPELQ